jgi:hypothetical protein
MLHFEISNMHKYGWANGEIRKSSNYPYISIDWVNSLDGEFSCGKRYDGVASEIFAN